MPVWSGSGDARGSTRATRSSSQEGMWAGMFSGMRDGSFVVLVEDWLLHPDLVSYPEPLYHGPCTPSTAHPWHALHSTDTGTELQWQ